MDEGYGIHDIYYNREVPRTSSKNTNRHLLVIPTFNCARQVPRLIQDLVPYVDNWDEVWFVDNASSDNTSEETLSQLCTLKNVFAGKTRVYENSLNVGLGGTHKAVFANASRLQFESITVFHGDHQAKAIDASRSIKFYKERNSSFVLGSRFMSQSNRSGYSLMRFLYNRLMNLLFSMKLKTSIYDLGSGINVFSLNEIASINYDDLPNDLTFNIELLKWIVKFEKHVDWVPIDWHEEDQVSNVKLVQQTIKTLKLLMKPFGRQGQRLPDGLEQKLQLID